MLKILAAIPSLNGAILTSELIPYDRFSSMQKPLATEYSPAYQKYFDLVPDGDHMELLRQNGDATAQFFEAFLRTSMNIAMRKESGPSKKFSCT